MVSVPALFLVVFILASTLNIPHANAQLYDMPWDLEPGVLFPCRYTTGTNQSGTLELWERKVFLRIENVPGYLHDVETWDDLPDANVSMIDTNGIVTEPEWFQYIIQDAGLTWTGHDWFKPAIPYLGVDEALWNAVFGDLIETWVGPWGIDIDVRILPDPLYEVYNVWDQTYWAVQYNFTYDGVFYDVFVSYWLYPSPSPSPYNSGLLQNVTITGEDSESGEIMNFFQLICDPSPPDIFAHFFIINPESGGGQVVESINYTVGDTGYWIHWRLDEDLPVDYTAYDNETIFAYGTFNFTYGRAEEYVRLSLDGLEVGVHNLTLVVTNSVGSAGSDSVLLTVSSVGWFDLGNMPLIVVGGAGAVLLIAVAVYLRRTG